MPIVGFVVSAAARQVLYDPASWWWEASTDGGTTWQGGVVEVPPTPHTVLVRARVEFNQDSGHRYFGGTYVDATVTHAGPGDRIQNWINLTSSFAPWATSRFGDVLKLDENDDVSPPGQGIGWITTGWGPPQGLPIPRFDSNLAIFSYELALDGTPGDRLVNGVFLPFAPWGLDRYIRTWRLRPVDSTTYYSRIEEYNPLTIRVVPSPGAIALPLGAIACFAPRRRR